MNIIEMASLGWTKLSKWFDFLTDFKQWLKLLKEEALISAVAQLQIV